MDEKTKAELESIERDIKMYQDNISAGVSEDLKKIIIEGIEKSQQRLKDITTELESKELDMDEIDKNSVRIVKSDVNKLLEETEEILSEISIQSEEVEEEVEGLEPTTPEDFLAPEKFKKTVEKEIIDLEDNTLVAEPEESENNPGESIAEPEDSEHWQEIPTLENKDTSTAIEETDDPEKSEDIEGKVELPEISEQTTIIGDIEIPIPEDQIPEFQGAEFQEEADNLEGIVVQLREPSEEYQKEAEIIVQNRAVTDDERSMLQFMAAKGILLEDCKEALLGTDREEELEETSQEQSEELAHEKSDYDKGERIR